MGGHPLLNLGGDVGMGLQQLVERGVGGGHGHGHGHLEDSLLALHGWNRCVRESAGEANTSYNRVTS